MKRSVVPEEEWTVEFYCNVRGQQETHTVWANSKASAIKKATINHIETCFQDVVVKPPLEIDHL